METRQLLILIAEVFTRSTHEDIDLDQGPKDRLRRRDDMSYFNPSPKEIRAATLLIQEEWTERERLVRATGSCGSRSWRAPHVRVLGTSLPDE
jgi:hypothetical protein